MGLLLLTQKMLLQGKFDGGVDPRQLLLGQLQADGVGQLGIQLAVELVEQADAGVEQLERLVLSSSLTGSLLFAIRLSRYWVFWNSWSRCWLSSNWARCRSAICSSRFFTSVEGDDSSC